MDSLGQVVPKTFVDVSRQQGVQSEVYDECLRKHKHSDPWVGAYHNNLWHFGEAQEVSALIGGVAHTHTLFMIFRVRCLYPNYPNNPKKCIRFAEKNQTVGLVHRAHISSRTHSQRPVRNV
jgi:hypothetical protein